MRRERLLDHDPELRAALAQSEIDAARDALVAPGFVIEPGRWEINGPANEQPVLGLLVVDGVLGLRTSIADRATLELVGRGDLLQPWVQLGAGSTIPATAEWHVMERARVLLLDGRFAENAAQWPEVTTELMHRLVLRSRRLCYQLAVNASPRIEERILYTLWALADRWGRVTDRGTVLRLALTHQLLAELVAAQRPSVSSALSALRQRGRLLYARDEFVLCGKVPSEVEALKKQVALTA